MSISRIFYGLALVLVLAVGWHYRNSDTVQSLIDPPSRHPVKVEFDNGTAHPPAPLQAVEPPKSVAGVRKCKKGNAVIYTDGNCPPDSKELSISSGSVTVVPGQSVGSSISSNIPALPASPSRDANPGADEQSIRDKMMERVINR